MIHRETVSATNKVHPRWWWSWFATIIWSALLKLKKITCNLISFLRDEAIFFLKNNSILFANLQVPLFHSQSRKHTAKNKDVNLTLFLLCQAVWTECARDDALLYTRSPPEMLLFCYLPVQRRWPRWWCDCHHAPLLAVTICAPSHDTGHRWLAAPGCRAVTTGGELVCVVPQDVTVCPTLPHSLRSVHGETGSMQDAGITATHHVTRRHP